MPDKNNTECKKCEIENCLECIGNNSYTQCIKCENNYILSGGICLKNCEIGENNRCLKCSDEPGKINQCSICNNGYYLPENNEYNNTQCEKCLINGCMTCSGNLIENKCTKCEAGKVSNGIKSFNEIKNCFKYEFKNDEAKCLSCEGKYGVTLDGSKCILCETGQFYGGLNCIDESNKINACEFYSEDGKCIKCSKYH